MLKYIIPLFLLPFLAMGNELDFDLLGPEAYRFDASPAPSLAAPAPSSSRAPSLVVESGLGMVLGVATAAAVFYPMAMANGNADGDGLLYVAGAGNALGSAAGIWLGGRLMGRSGSPAMAMVSAAGGHLIGVLAGLALYRTNQKSLSEAPIALSLTVALPTVLGLVGYNLTD